MGVLKYGESDEPLRVDDRTLAHLQAVITTKLRRHESFTLSWQHPESGDEETIWLHPSIPLRFVFEGTAPRDFNAAWLDRLMRSANSTGGIKLVEEADPEG
ncbi:hypothetical protein [Microbacterium sp. AR7-10]|uniref:DUF7882 family protein n=1 Tax=Microbacterium sp. AR7-10 TaxID=1891970 RepID=UPI0008FC65ED|nr:hypothetical protein [Microbacterium sp. AR7-10]OIU88687.1 hypothetical protein BFN01_04340 [Microbacterium sp. AR7-10]